jgi:hypothetical protein
MAPWPIWLHYVTYLPISRGISNTQITANWSFSNKTLRIFPMELKLEVNSKAIKIETVKSIFFY